MTQATRAGEFEDSPSGVGYGARLPDRDWLDNYALEMAHAHPAPPSGAEPDDVPEWAKAEVFKLAREGRDDRAYVSESMIIDAFARYIAAHEPAPVDPLEIVMQDVWDGGRARQQSDANLTSIAALAQALRARLPGIDDLARQAVSDKETAA